MEEELKNDYEFLSKLDMELTEIANWMQELENILKIKARPINSDDLNKRQGAGWLRFYGINQFYDEQRKLGILSRLRETRLFKSFHYTKINDLKKTFLTKKFYWSSWFV